MRSQPWSSLTVVNVSRKSLFISIEEVWNGSRLSPAGAGNGTGYTCILSASHPAQHWNTGSQTSDSQHFEKQTSITNSKPFTSYSVIWIELLISKVCQKLLCFGYCFAKALRDASRLVPSTQQAAVQRCLGTWRYMKSPNKIYSVN